jgi:REP element-mobilizing transposase RayT
MALGYHLIWTAYGWWLPNDPRGSGSGETRVSSLRPLGDIHLGRKAVQPPASELRHFLQQSKDHLKYEPRVFTADEVQIIADAFRSVIRDNKYACHACVIMPEHVHLLMGRRLAPAEAIVAALREASRDALIAAKCFPPTHAVWTAGQRIIYKSTPAAMIACIKYIEDNPLEIGGLKQSWDFVTAYDSEFRPF